MDQLKKDVRHSGRRNDQSNFDLRFIKKIVQQIEAGLPVLAAVAEYKLKTGTVRKWLNKYGSVAYLQQRKKPTSAQVRRTVTRAVSLGKMTIHEAGLAHGVNQNTVRVWMKNYTSEKDDLADSNLVELAKKNLKNNPVSPEIPPEVKVLQEQLAYATLKIAALNTLIDVAEEQLQINIRKKPGTRQL
jgi:transposase-like protein